MRCFVLMAVMLALTSVTSAQMGKVEQQVLQAEKDRFAAMVKGDRAALENQLATGFTAELDQLHAGGTDIQAEHGGVLTAKQ